MAKDVGDCLTIFQNVIGQSDGEDPQATAFVLIGYISDFIDLIMPQDVKLKENFDFFTFTTVADQDEYPINVAPLPINEFVNIGEPVWIVDTSVNSSQRMCFFQDPELFFDRWPLPSAALTAGKPTAILYFDDKLFLRTVPNKAYDITLIGYKTNGTVDSITDELFKDYFWRYIAYGAALDWFADHGQVDQVNLYMPIFERYRELVLSRTAQQLINTRALPSL